MSWPMPTAAAGQWTAAGMANMAMTTPDMNSMNSMNMGGYTPDQWTAMQQQNWQQWAQWQQQYAQWQQQYGDKYQQMQFMQAMGGMPPLPTVGTRAAPPAPPPPEKPPPPPPEQNNQPLYGNTGPSQPAAVAPPAQRNAVSGYNNTNFTGNNQSWSQTAAVSQQEANQGAAVNVEALKKLAEEERLFDIQFQKWEEEIQKWKKENANHPDKEAYKEYEAKFEACRLQLLERRQQMNQRKARLLGNMPQAASTAPTGNNVPPTTTTKPSVNQNVQQQNYPNQPNNSNQTQNNVQMQFTEPPPAFNNNRGSNKTVDPQAYEAYQTMDNYLASSNNFLPASANSKGIPGLDLVPESEKPTSKQDVIDITGENSRPVAPDYTKISKGINNILGDEKIMNILSMVKVQNAPEGTNTVQNTPSSMDGPSGGGTVAANSNIGTGVVGGSMIPGGQYAANANSYYNMAAMNMPYQWDNQYNNQYNNPYNNPYNSQQYGFQQNMPMNTVGPPPLMQQMINPSAQVMGYNGGQDQYYGNAQFIEPHQGGRPPGLAGHQNEQYRGPQENNGNQLPPRTKWVEDPLLTPSIIVEYEHKPLRLKGREFIEPVHTFDYNHISKEEEYKKKDFEREVDELFARIPRRIDDDFSFANSNDRFPIDRGERVPLDRGNRFSREPPSRDFERRPREEIREDFQAKAPPREEYEDRRRVETTFYDRRRDDRDKFTRRDDYRERDDFRSKEDFRGRDRYRRDDIGTRSRSRDKDSRKRGRSKESEASENSKRSKESEKKQGSDGPKPVIMVDDILEPPGREMRPEKIVIILRGPPGSGKSYLAKLIRDKEAEYGGTARIMSIDDYFMQEGEIEETDPVTLKIVKKPTMKYEYDESLEETYVNSLKRAFKRSLTDGYFSFLIYDAVNDQLKSYADIWNYARQNGFQVYIITLELDPQICFKRNIHGRSLEDIQVICSRFFPTPSHHIELDPTTLLQNAAIAEVQMEDVTEQAVIEAAPEEVETSFTSKWEKMDDIEKLARLDGTSKRLRASHLSMEDYLQIDDWTPTQSKPGKKTVRWADIEERRQQEKMRAIGFVVGQTDWDRMTDPTMGSSALTKTKYIARVRRN